MSRFGENGRVGGGWINCGERDGADIWSGRWLWAESGRKMIEKVDVGNEKMYIAIISVRQMEVYVKSWVSLILGVRWARKQLLVRGDTTPCVDSTQSLCGLHTQTGAGGGGAEVRGKSGGSESLQAAIPHCGRKRYRPWTHQEPVGFLGTPLPYTSATCPRPPEPRARWGRHARRAVPPAARVSDLGCVCVCVCVWVGVRSRASRLSANLPPRPAPAPPPPVCVGSPPRGCGDRRAAGRGRG